MFHGSHVLSSWHSTLYHSWWSWTLVFLRHQSNHKHIRPQHRVAAFCSPRCIALWRRSAGGALPRHSGLSQSSWHCRHKPAPQSWYGPGKPESGFDFCRPHWLMTHGAKSLMTSGQIIYIWRQAVLKIAHAVTHFHRHVKATGSKKCFTFILTAQVLEHLGR